MTDPYESFSLDVFEALDIYFEKLEITAAKRRAELSEPERTRQRLSDAFYERGIALAARDEAGQSLDPDERLLLSLYLLGSGVNNGGFSTYIVNTEGLQLGDCSEGLTQVGASQLASVIQDVLRLFPAGFDDGLTDELWRALEEQRKALEALDTRFYESEENLSELAMTHLEQ